MFIRNMHGEEKKPQQSKMYQKNKCSREGNAILNVPFRYIISIPFLLPNFLPLLYFIYASYPVKSFHCFSPECG